MENENELVTLLNLLTSNQLKIMASNQVHLLQTARLIAALTKADPLALVEEFDGLYSQELEKLQFAHLQELGNLSLPQRKGPSPGSLD